MGAYPGWYEGLLDLQRRLALERLEEEQVAEIRALPESDDCPEDER